jgi:hypothetical protein
MTSLRELKKDINYLCTEFVADCYLMLHMNPGNDETIDTIADKVIDARNALVYLMHHPENKGQSKFNKDIAVLKSRNKEHKEKIKIGFEEFLKLIDNCYEELQKLNK